MQLWNFVGNERLADVAPAARNGACLPVASCPAASRRSAARSASASATLSPGRPARRCLDTIGDSLRRESCTLGEPSRGDEADPHRLSVGHRIVTDVFEGIGERVPQVEDRSTRLFERIILDDRDLDLDRLSNQHLELPSATVFLMARPMPFASLELRRRCDPEITACLTTSAMPDEN